MPNLWQETPLIKSSYISKTLDCSAYLKLENLHPSHSFKYRGISLFIQRNIDKHGPDVHIVIASGGNAGLAAACAANALQVRCTVYLPEGAAQRTIDLLRNQKADVVVAGKFYLQALEKAREIVQKETNAVMVPAYDDPVVWEGHSSMIAEIAARIPKKPDAIFCSVGGAGLLGGIIVGCKNVGWDDIPIIALATIGSNCFYHSMSLNPGKFNSVSKQLPDGIDLIRDDANGVFLAHLNSFSSRASGSLGASSPSPAIVKMALERKGGVVCVSVPDELSMQAAVQFADDHKMLVELACSTTLTAAYKPSLFAKVVPSDVNSDGPGPKTPKTIVFIVCGGFKTSLKDMDEYERIVETDLLNQVDDSWEVLVDGQSVRVAKQ